MDDSKKNKKVVKRKIRKLRFTELIITNWILLILTFIFVACSILLYFYWKEFLAFIKEWQGILTSIILFTFYLMFFVTYILYEKRKKKRWQNKKKSDLNFLYENNKYDKFINYDQLIDEIKKLINIFFNYQDQRYVSNILLIKGEYGLGKTFLITNVLKELKIQNLNFYYINLATIENQSRNDFSNYLFNEIIKCVSYNKYLEKLLRLKFFKILSKNLPFNLISDEISIKNGKEKTLIILDEIDRCEPDNIISTFTILKTQFLKIPNVIFVILLNEDVIQPLIMDYFKISNINNSEKSKKLYELFIQKLSTTSINMKNNLNFEFHQLDFLKENKLLIYTKTEANFYLNKNLQNKNPRSILSEINNETFAKKYRIFNFLKKNKKTLDRKIIVDLLEIIQYFGLFEILANKKVLELNEINIPKAKFNFKYSLENYNSYLIFQKFINIDKNGFYKVSIEKKKNHEDLQLIKNRNYSFLTTNQKENIFAASNNKIWKLNIDAVPIKFIDLDKEYIIVNLLSVKNLIYVAFSNNKIWQLDSDLNFIKSIDLKSKLNEKSIILSLAGDDRTENLYISSTNNNKILKINKEGIISFLEDFQDLEKAEFIILANKVMDNKLFFFTNESNYISYISSDSNNWELSIKNFEQIPVGSGMPQKLYVNDYNDLYFLSIFNNESKVYKVNYSNRYSYRYSFPYNNSMFHLIINVSRDRIISLIEPIKNNFYFSTLDNPIYEITSDFRFNYDYVVSDFFLSKILNTYSKYYVFKQNKLKKMDFMDFYFIMNSKIIFNLIYKNVKKEIKYKDNKFDNKFIKEIIKKSYYLLKIIDSPSIAIVLEYEPEKYKVIFDLSEGKLITFDNFTDMYWKLSEINKKNVILKNYNQNIHNSLLNLLSNKEWKNSFNNISDYIEKKSKKEIFFEKMINNKQNVDEKVSFKNKNINKNINVSKNND